jgi:hypothetical protein
VINNVRKGTKKISRESRESLIGKKLRDNERQKSLRPSKKRRQPRKLSTILGRTLFKLMLRENRIWHRQRKLFQK